MDVISAVILSRWMSGVCRRKVVLAVVGSDLVKVVGETSGDGGA